MGVPRNLGVLETDVEERLIVLSGSSWTEIGVPWNWGVLGTDVTVVLLCNAEGGGVAAEVIAVAELHTAAESSSGASPVWSNAF